MKSIITTYPECQTPPQEVKILVLAPKGQSFDKADSPRDEGRRKVPETTLGLHTDVRIQIQSAGYWS